MDHGPLIIDLIFVIFAVVSAILYVTILAILIVKRKIAPFKSYFFQLFISLGIADLGSGLTAYVEKTRQWGWVDWAPLYMDPSMGWLFRRLPAGCYIVFGMSQYYGVVALAANRLYNIQNNLWRAKNQLISLILQWSIPTIFVIPYVSQDFMLFINNASGVSHMSSSPTDHFNGTYGAIITSSQVVVVVVVAALYCQIYSRVRKIKHDYGLTEDNRSELKLALVGFILFVIMSAQQFVTAVLVMSMILNESSLFSFVHGILYQFAIIFAFINPWVLLVCSKPTREALQDLICPKIRPFRSEDMDEDVEMHTLPKMPLRPRPAIPEDDRTRF